MLTEDDGYVDLVLRSKFKICTVVIVLDIRKGDIKLTIRYRF